MKNCYIYCRVSTDEQAEKGYSLDAQEKLCRDFAERNGYNVTSVYRDEGKSATNLDRAALQELLSRCTKESSIDAVFVQETDRLARNTKDHLTIKAMLKKAEVKLVSVAQPMLDDSPEGMMIDTILASVNQFQSDINSRKTKRGMQERFDQGWYPGMAPLGYLNAATHSNSQTDRDAKMIARDPDRWEHIQYGLRLYLSGHYAVAEINDILYEHGLRSRQDKKIAHSVMTRTLRSPFYAGLMKWDGQERIGAHEPMLTLDEHQQILQIMEAHNLHACRRRKHSFLLSGFVFCNICGHRYTAEKHAGKGNYYHCASRWTHSNRHQNVTDLSLERQIEKEFKSIQFSEWFTRRIIAQLHTAHLAQRQAIKSSKQTLCNQKRAVEAKRDKAEEKLLAGVIQDDDFTRLRVKFTDELGHIQEAMEELDQKQSIELDVVQEVLRLSRDIHSAYMKAPYELKRQYLGLFWERFLVQDRRIIKAVPTDLVQTLQREQKVIIRDGWYPSPALIRIVQNHEYMAGLRSKLNDIISQEKAQVQSARR